MCICCHLAFVRQSLPVFDPFLPGPCCWSRVGRLSEFIRIENLRRCGEDGFSVASYHAFPMEVEVHRTQFGEKSS